MVATREAGMENVYDHREIEPRWQETWQRDGTLRPRGAPGPGDTYVLDMFPNPSGPLHMGHCKNYSIGDVVARYRVRRGENVFHPMGWDAFGLPGEIAAQQAGAHPRDWTLRNIRIEKAQFRKLGIDYDWSHEICSCDPEYYRWNQWLFLKMLERGLAYRADAPVNWCARCNTSLANEEVVAGACERCGTEAEKRPMRQWFLRTTAYADELLEGLDALEGWPDRIRTMQRNWIGRAEGAEVKFAVEGSDLELDVFTTRPDTIYGVTFMALSPEHPAAARLCGNAAALDRVRKAQTEVGDVPVGVPTGAEARHPLTGALVPIWVADYVLLEYGTGAVMGVPAHDARDFAFAEAHGLPIERVVDAPGCVGEVLPYEDPGTMVSSGQFSGLSSAEGGAAVAAALSERGAGGASVSFRLRDWCISRQRYWGTPIPVVHCEKCGVVPVPEELLPVRLPHMVAFKPDGRSPLARHEGFVNALCPACGGHAERECDTMTGFVCSAWYFLRFTSPDEAAGPFDPEAVRRWAPVKCYIGGKEHAVGHLLFSRFVTRVLRDMGLVDFSEPFAQLYNQGVVYKGGAKMSKSKGNVVSVDEVVERYGADTARMFVLFATPPDRDMAWNDSGVEGIHRFLGRVWRAVSEARTAPEGSRGEGSEASTEALTRATHRAVKAVTVDMERMHYNTAISRLMELTTAVQQASQGGAGPAGAALREARETLVSLLAPFAPHICEELWSAMGKCGSVHRAQWPVHDPSWTATETATVVVQVDGRVRDRFEAPVGTPDSELEATAASQERVQAHLVGCTVRRTVVVPDRLVNFVTG